MTTEKLGLHNLSPAPGSTRDRKRIGRYVIVWDTRLVYETGQNDVV